MSYIKKVNTTNKPPEVVAAEVVEAVDTLIKEKNTEFRQHSAEHALEIITTNWMLKKLAECRDEAIKCTTIEKAQQMCAIAGSFAMEYPPGSNEEEQKKWCYCEHPDSKIIAFWYNPAVAFSQHGKPYADHKVMTLPEADDPLVSVFGKDDE